LGYWDKALQDTAGGFGVDASANEWGLSFRMLQVGATHHLARTVITLTLCLVSPVSRARAAHAHTHTHTHTHIHTHTYTRARAHARTHTSVRVCDTRAGGCVRFCRLRDPQGRRRSVQSDERWDRDHRQNRNRVWDHLLGLLCVWLRFNRVVRASPVSPHPMGVKAVL
jgi:hypothetical protein